MDPLLTMADRTQARSLLPVYDQRWFMDRNHHKIEELTADTTSRNEFYMDIYLYELYKEHRVSVSITDAAKLAYERGHPLWKVREFFPDVDLDLMVFNVLFGIPKTTEVVRSKTLTPLTALLKELLSDRPAANFIVRVGQMTSKLAADTLYMASLHYDKITMLQPAVSSSRYLLCLGYAGDELFSKELKQQLSSLISSSGVTSFLSSLPPAFERWLVEINNIHTGLITEQLINLIGAKKAFDAGQYYTSGISYDIQALVKYIRGQPMHQRVIKSKLMQTDEEIEIETFPKSLHLKFSAEKSETGRLRRVVDIDGDEALTMKYDKTRSKDTMSGDHWGQRKLLMGEIDFFTQNIEPEEKVLVIYIGAFPCHHGSLILNMFTNLNMWLIDGRDNDVCSPKLNSFGNDERVMITSAMYDSVFADQLVDFLKNRKDLEEDWPKLAENTRFSDRWASVLHAHDYDKLLFVSDIRSGDSQNESRSEFEQAVANDLRVQAYGLQNLADVAPKNEAGEAKFRASLKFRLPFEYKDEVFPYISGVIRTQPWAGLQSAETRLWVSSGFKPKEYNLKKYEELMTYHNVVFRSQEYAETNVEGYGVCHDCNMEVDILKTYFAKFSMKDKKNRQVTDTETLMFNMNKRITSLFGMTLGKHAELSSFTKRKLTRHYHDNMLRFSPIREVIVSDFHSRMESGFVTIMTGTKLFQAGQEKDLRHLFRHIIWLRTMLYKLTVQHYNLDNVERIQVMIRDQFNKTVGIEVIEDVLTQYNELWVSERQRTGAQLRKGMPELTVSAEVITKKGQPTELILTARHDRRVVKSLATSQKFAQRILTLNERGFDFKSNELMKDDIARTRMFCILRRYRNAWHKTLALSPRFLYMSHGMLPGIECSTSMIAAHENKEKRINERFCVSYDDFEFLYTTQNNLMRGPVDELVITKPVISVFPPDIPELTRMYMTRMLEIIELNDKTDLAIIFVIPEVSGIEKLRSSAYFTTERPFDGRVWNYLTASADRLDHSRTIIVLKTSTSSFKL